MFLHRLIVCLWLPVACAATPLMTPRDLMALPVKAPDHIIKYGDHPSQYGELRLPRGRGLQAVVVLVHGGCFRQEFADAKSIGAMADALKAAGIATWSLEYRRLPEPGSGWPGTYLDVAAGVDHLRTIAAQHRLDMRRIVFLGHSAGAHLAHWAAARARLRPADALYTRDPLQPLGVINLAGRMDMTVGIEEYEASCFMPVLRRLLGGTPEQVPDRYAQVSLPALVPLGVRQTLIWGSRENYVPESQARDFVAAARAAGDQAELLIVPEAGHFETASPASMAWPTVLSAIRSVLAVPTPSGK